MRRWWILVLSVGCGGSDGPSGPSGNTINLDGSWSYSFNVSNSQLQTSCVGSGTLSIDQSGAQFSGSSQGQTTCTGPSGQVTDQVSGVLTGGTISGSSISFLDDDGCQYTGSVSGNPVNRASGQASCDLAFQGQTYTFTGTWQASR